MKVWSVNDRVGGHVTTIRAIILFGVMPARTRTSSTNQWFRLPFLRHLCEISRVLYVIVFVFVCVCVYVYARACA